MSDLRGRRIVVTGGAGGIGSAAIAALRERGANVEGIDLLGTGKLVAGDVTDPDAIRAAMETCAHRLGGIDVLVNNAGIGRPQDAGDFPDAAAHAVMEVNFFGAWNATAAALPYLLESRGHVVNVASGLAIVDIPFAAAYAASKRALVAYSETLRVEYRGRVTVTTVYPGYIRTSIHDAAAASGASLEGLVRADTVEGAAVAIVRACVKRPKAIATSRLSTLELWAARRFPQATAATIARRVTRWKRQRPAPGFVRYPDRASWGS
ncbi:MAG TPA: SDR family NAD(P)-dependent oxidoreductase [Actinomycetota bacterium]|nr:SDR family NAD(P)-dependent oxidoreductase [Actinomycetota bacterium]